MRMDGPSEGISISGWDSRRESQSKSLVLRPCNTTPWFLGRYMVAGKRRLPFLGEASPEVKEKLRRDGALVQIQISIPTVLADQMRAQGQTVPPPQIAVGMIDTGASISTVSEAVAQAAGLQQVGSVPISGVGGTSERPVMSCSFGLPEYGVVVDPAEIVVVTINAPGFEILVGRDILQALELKYQGPHGLFNLTSDVSSPAAAGASPAPGLGTWLGVGAAAVAIGVGALYVLDVI